MELLHLMPVQHIGNDDASLSILTPAEWEGNDFLVFDLIAVLIRSRSQIHSCLCGQVPFQGISGDVENRFGMELCIRLIAGGKFHIDDREPFTADFQFKGVGKRIDAEPAGIDGTDESADVLVVLTLCFGQPWVFAYTPNGLLSIDFGVDVSNGGDFGFVCMTTREF